MKIATFNVNGINSRLPQLLQWLEREAPDVACLQELKAADTQFPLLAIQGAGYQALYQGQRSWNGVAILSRSLPVIERRRGLPGDPADEQSRYIEADIGGLRLACLYLPNGNPQPGPKFDYKLSWFERLIRHTNRLYRLECPVILAGDFNVVPTDFDIYDPKSWRKDALLQPQSRDAYRRLLDQGWLDALRDRHQNERVYTFWDYFRNHWQRDAGLRIDHLLLNAQAAARLVNAQVDRWVRGEPHASDHAPVWIELSDQQRSKRGRRPTDGSAKPRARSSARTSPPREKPAAPPGVAAPLPATLRPVLATLVAEPPADDTDWMFEAKFDGYRLLARVEGDDVRLLTRNGNDWTARLPHLVAALRKLKLAPAWLDGEMIAPDAAHPTGTSFQALQNAFDSERTGDIVYYLFDLPYYEGRNLTRVPLTERRSLLAQLLRKPPTPLRLSEAFAGAPQDLLDSACKAGLEGLIGKRKSSAYTSRRSTDWIKLKCHRRQEFVIGGWTDPKGSRVGVGALLLGVYGQKGELHYAGKVGTGFDAPGLAAIRRSLNAIESNKSPFSASIAEQRAAHWVNPTLVAEVSFFDWTDDNRLRHPVFVALRTDKPARSIVRERGLHMADKAVSKTAAVGLADVRLTHPDKVIDPSTGTTKREIAEYYAQVGKLMLEHLKERPVSLVRAPSGIDRPLFFQKHLEKGEIDGIARLDPRLDRDHVALLTVANARGLLSASQMNVIEFHTWNCRASTFVTPDRMTFDLDPGEGVRWPAMQQAAMLVKAFLDELGLAAFLKTSGGKGLHVVTPIRTHYGWDDVRNFSEAVVLHLARTLPQQFVAKSGPRNRVGKIFIDYLRNGFGATTACAWSVRARAGLGISVPLDWSELDTVQSGSQWTVKNYQARLTTGNQPWKGYGTSAKHPKAAMKRLEFKPTGKQDIPVAGRR